MTRISLAQRVHTEYFRCGGSRVRCDPRPARSHPTRSMRVRMTRKLGSRVHFLAAICLVLPLLAGCEERKQAAAPPAKPAVGVRPAAMKGVSRSFEFVGRIKAVDKVEVRARVEGFLEKVLFREGQDVKAGDLLYQIEKVQFARLHVLALAEQDFFEEAHD